MVRHDEIAVVINSQREMFLKKTLGLTRSALPNIPIADSSATIITRIRRCGKSIILLQLLNRDYQNAIYLNFEDIRLAGFEMSDFIRRDFV